MSRNLRFKKGDLLIVKENYKYYGDGLFGNGPRIAGFSTILMKNLSPGEIYLALSDVQHANRSQNRKLYIEIMTTHGPKVCWARAFKMKKSNEEKENAPT